MKAKKAEKSAGAYDVGGAGLGLLGARPQAGREGLVFRQSNLQPFSGLAPQGRRVPRAAVPSLSAPTAKTAVPSGWPDGRGMETRAVNGT
jgi:hypothetical protein